MKSTIYPGLWFDGKAREAAEFYCSVFHSAEIKSESGQAVLFEASGQPFLCINGNDEFTPNPSISFYTVFDDKQELDRAWEKLMMAGTVLMPLDQYAWSPRYGWLQDKYNVSWQLSLEKPESEGQIIAPSLLFTGKQNGKAHEAIEFYTSVFHSSQMRGIYRYTGDGDDIKGNVAHARFLLEEKVFMATESSLPHPFSFNEAVSLIVECPTQQEIDYYWKHLSAVPEAEQCGWLKDKYGISWQIIPSVLNEMMRNKEKAENVKRAFLQMKKFNIRQLQEAYRS